MGVQHQIKKIIESFKGIEKRKSDLIDKPGFFAELKNAQMRPSGALSKRKGFFTIAENVGSLGVASYRGKTQSELLAIDETLCKITISDIVFSTSQNKTLNISLLPNDEGNLIFKVADPSSEVVLEQEINLGDGYSITTQQNDLTISDLQTAISTLPSELSINMSVTSTEKAAFIEPFGIQTIQGGANPRTFTTSYFIKTVIAQGDSSVNPFTGLFNRYNTPGVDIEPASTAILNNVMYFGTGYDDIMKYDGSKVYRAGLPTPSTPSLAKETSVANPENTSGDPIGLEHTHISSSTDEEYHYMIVYTHTDAQGNTIKSSQSADAKVGWGAQNHFVKITIPMLQPGTGFDLANTKIEIYRAPKSTLDETAPAANYYLVTDGTQGDIVRSTDVPAGTYINLDSNNAINNDPITNNSSVASLVYLDYLADDKINNNDFISQGDYSEGRHDLPPRGKYITAHQGCLVISGNVSNPTEIFYSLPSFNLITGEIGTEYFPNNANSVIVDGFAGGPIKAIRSLKDNLYVFHENTVSYLSGDLTTVGVQTLRHDSLSTQGEIGASSHSSIQEYEGTLMFLNDEGISVINNSVGYPEEVSTAIKPLLLKKELKKELAVSYFDADNDIIIFYIPKQDADPVTYVLDVKRSAWIEWDNIDIQGGIVRHNKQTFFVSKDKNMLRLQKLKNRGDESDYSDHNEAIPFEAITAWDSLGEPNVFKKFLRLKIFITDTNLNFETDKFKLDLYLRRNFSSLDLGPIELDSGYLGGWGANDWSEFEWGSVGTEGIRTKMFGKAKSMALKFKNNTINENILISGLSYEVAAPYQTEMKE